MQLILRTTVVAVWICVAMHAQEAPPVLENDGKPITLPFQCTDEDIRWGGLTCSEDEPCPVYFELTGAEPVGSKIFATGNLHSDTITLYSILLASDDSGRTWHEAFRRIRGAGLDHIQFSDLLNGWTGGQQLSPLPQDPFLLITNDGGKTWTEQPVFSESEPGSVQQFYFSSKDQGSLIIDRGEGSPDDRYALYETPNGGRTWMVKQLSTKPLRLRGPEAQSDWRIRTDRATQSFRIEHRQTDRWTAAASFTVRVGYCKPAPEESPAPAEAEPEAPKPEHTTPQN